MDQFIKMDLRYLSSLNEQIKAEGPVDEASCREELQQIDLLGKTISKTMYPRGYTCILENEFELIFSEDFVRFHSIKWRSIEKHSIWMQREDMMLNLFRTMLGYADNIPVPYLIKLENDLLLLLEEYLGTEIRGPKGYSMQFIQNVGHILNRIIHYLWKSSVRMHNQRFPCCRLMNIATIKKLLMPITAKFFPTLNLWRTDQVQYLRAIHNLGKIKARNNFTILIGNCVHHIAENSQIPITKILKELADVGANEEEHLKVNFVVPHIIRATKRTKHRERKPYFTEDYAIRLLNGYIRHLPGHRLEFAKTHYYQALASITCSLCSKDSLKSNNYLYFVFNDLLSPNRAIRCAAFHYACLKDCHDIPSEVENWISMRILYTDSYSPNDVTIWTQCLPFFRQELVPFVWRHIQRLSSDLVLDIGSHISDDQENPSTLYLLKTLENVFSLLCNEEVTFTKYCREPDNGRHFI